jgi:hypothetical protein
MTTSPAPAPRRISARIGGIAESATLAVDAKAKAKKAAGEDVVGFGAGEPDFPTPALIVAAAEKACADPKNHRYTPAGGMPELKAAIAEKTKRDSGFEVTAAQVLVTNGGKQAVYQAFATLLDPGDEVLLPAPYWTTYPEAVKLAGGLLGLGLGVDGQRRRLGDAPDPDRDARAGRGRCGSWGTGHGSYRGAPVQVTTTRGGRPAAEHGSRGWAPDRRRRTLVALGADASAPARPRSEAVAQQDWTLGGV